VILSIKPDKPELRYTFTVLLFLIAIFASGQENNRRSGIRIEGATTDENGLIVPRTGIYSFRLQKGYSSDSLGVFSINSVAGDTIIFISPGYKPTILTLPSESSFNAYTAEVHMVKDTIAIDEVVILPFKTYHEFKNAIASENTVTPETENMNYNLSLVKRQLYDRLIATPGEGYRFAFRQISNDCYTKGQLH